MAKTKTSDASVDTETMKVYEAWVKETAHPLLTDEAAGDVADEAYELQLAVDEDDAEGILLECGDVLYYLTRILHNRNYTLDDCMIANTEKLINREKYGKGKHGKRS